MALHLAVSAFVPFGCAPCLAETASLAAGDFSADAATGFWATLLARRCCQY